MPAERLLLSETLPRLLGRLVSSMRTWLLDSRWGSILAIMVLLALTLWMGWKSHTEVVGQAQQRFDARVSQIKFAIEQRMLAYQHVLKGGVGLFRASDAVTRNDWRAYVENLDIDRHYPGIQGVGFSLHLLPSELERHIERVRGEGFSDYRVWPMAPRQEYTAILYLEPFDWRNQRAFGYDMFSEPVRHEAMARARDSGSPAVSGKVTLVQETDKEVQHGFLMYLPVYRKEHVDMTPEERSAALLGYVYSPFRMNDLMRGILGLDALPNIRLEVFDGAEMTSGSVLYDSQSAAAPSEPSAFSVTERFDINGRTWTLRFSSLPPFESSVDWQRPYLISLVGFMVVGLFVLVLWGLAMNRRRVTELARFNRELQAEVTARAQLMSELQGAKEAAEAANNAKSDFLANVSHELRTPLTLILAPLDELLARSSVQPLLRRQLRRIQRNALLLLGRVNEILDFAKADAGKLEVNWETVELEPLLAPLIEDVGEIAKRKHSRLTCHIQPGMGSVCVDPELFEKIALNLLSNALKFTPGEGSIHIDARALDPQWFELSVANSGSLISEADQGRLFQRFQQLDVSVTRNFGGTGLGLALVKELTELMGGQVGVENCSDNRGVRFYVRLPRQSGESIVREPADREGHQSQHAALREARLEEAADIQGREDRKPVVADTAVTRPTVLVADDTRDMRLYIAELLSEDFDVLVASDGAQAWELLQCQAVDAVVSDIMMPALDGLALTERIKASPRLSSIPVILVTARGGADESVSGLEAGADDYVAKPFSAAELRARVNSALRMAEIQTILREKTRDAGLAMLASGILHNLGNALNGVTVSVSLIRGGLQKSGIGRLRKITSLLDTNRDRLSSFLIDDPAGQRLPEFLVHLSDLLETEQREQLQELGNLQRYLNHAIEVVESHRRFVRATEVQEHVAADELMESALKLSLAATDLKCVSVERHYECSEQVSIDRYKVSQILINLLVNAQQALLSASQPEKELSLETHRSDGMVVWVVRDNGIGFNVADSARIFTQGFSTKLEGMGLGLHLSALWAQELGGTLECRSEGPGMGASFILKIPCEQVN